MIVNMEQICRLLIFYFGFQGRMSRGQYWPSALSTIITWVCLFLAGSWIALFILLQSDPHELSSVEDLQLSIYAWGAPVVYSLSLIHFISISAKRLHDMDNSGWWLLFWLMPLAFTFLCIFITFFLLPVIVNYYSAENHLTILAKTFSHLIMISILTSFLTWLVMMIVFTMGGTTATNRFGEDPRRKPSRKSMNRDTLGITMKLYPLLMPFGLMILSATNLVWLIV